MSSVEVLKVLKWIGELERRTTSAELVTLPRFVLSWSLKTRFRFRVQWHISYIYGCQAPIDVRVNGYNMLWVQLQAEGGMQSNTDKSCLLIPFTSAPNTWQNRNQIFSDAGHWPLGHRSEEFCALHSLQWRYIQLVQKRLYISTVSFDKTSARPPHLVQVLTLPPDDILRQLKKPEESFERALISPLKREPASCSRRIETGKPWTREKLARGRRRFQFFGYRS